MAKWGGIKLFECPLSCITPQTWEIIKAVNNTTNEDGYPVRSFRSMGWDDEPMWYKQAVEVVQRERAAHRKKQLDEQKAKNGRPR